MPPRHATRPERAVPADTRNEWYEVAEWDHRSFNGEVIHLFEQRRREIEKEQLKAAQVERTYPVTLDETLDAHYRERTTRSGRSVQAEILRDVEQWHEHQRFVQNEKERL